MNDTFISDGLTRKRISPSTEDKQRDIETRLEELKLLYADIANVFATSPIEGETQRLTHGTADTDASVGVAPGATYVFTSLVTGGFYFGLADTQTAINVRWICGLNSTILIKIPAGEATLHYATAVNSGIGYLRRIE